MRGSLATRQYLLMDKHRGGVPASRATVRLPGRKITRPPLFGRARGRPARKSLLSDQNSFLADTGNVEGPIFHESEP